MWFVIEFMLATETKILINSMFGFLGIVSSICNTFNVPHFRYDWMVEEPEKTKPNHAMTFNMYPNSNSLSRALADLLVDYSWRKFVIIYERDEGNYHRTHFIGHCSKTIINLW